MIHKIALDGIIRNHKRKMNKYEEEYRRNEKIRKKN